MSARSRALHRLGRHFEHLAAKAEELGDRPLYSAEDQWLHAADMAHRTAVEETWRGRAEGLSWRVESAARSIHRRLRQRRSGRPAIPPARPSAPPTRTHRPNG
jgi:hypothetical protein